MNAKTVKAAVDTLKRICIPEKGGAGVVRVDDSKIMDYALGKRTPEEMAIEDYAACVALDTLAVVVAVVRTGRRSKADDAEWGLFECLKREKSPEPEYYLQSVYRGLILDCIANFEQTFGNDYAFADTQECRDIFRV